MLRLGSVEQGTGVQEQGIIQSESGPDFFPVTLGMEMRQRKTAMKRCCRWEKGGLVLRADFGGQLLHILTKVLGAFCPSAPGLVLPSTSPGSCRLEGVGFIQRLPRAGSLLSHEHTRFSICITQVGFPVCLRRETELHLSPTWNC